MKRSRAENEARDPGSYGELVHNLTRPSSWELRANLVNVLRKAYAAEAERARRAGGNVEALERIDRLLNQVAIAAIDATRQR